MIISLDKSSQMAAPYQRHDATWQDYVAVGDSTDIDWRKIAFHQGWLWVDIGTEWPNHASFSDLMTMIFGFWAFLYPDIALQSYAHPGFKCLNRVTDRTFGRNPGTIGYGNKHGGGKLVNETGANQVLNRQPAIDLMRDYPLMVAALAFA